MHHQSHAPMLQQKASSFPGICDICQPSMSPLPPDLEKGWRKNQRKTFSHGKTGNSVPSLAAQQLSIPLWWEGAWEALAVFACCLSQGMAGYCMP